MHQKGFKCLFKHTFLQAGTEVDAAIPNPVDTGLTSIPLKPLPAKHQLTVSLPLGKVSTVKINFACRLID